MRLPGNPFLPPGMTDRMTDGGGENCEQCEDGKIIESPCCGKKLMTTETGVFCSLCLGEVCDLNCEACGGEGVIYPPTREEIEEMKADADEDR